MVEIEWEDGEPELKIPLKSGEAYEIIWRGERSILFVNSDGAGVRITKNGYIRGCNDTKETYKDAKVIRNITNKIKIIVEE